MSRFFDTTFLDKLGSDDNENCSVIISRNATRAFEFERGWEGIPFNFILNSIIFLVSNIFHIDHCFGITQALDFDPIICTASKKSLG